MASIKIHQDLFNFKRTRKGFTDRQIACFGIAVGITAGFTLLLGFALEIGYQYAVTVGIFCAIPAIVAGFVPIYGMDLEEFLQRFMDLASRGNAFGWNGEEVEPMKGETTREYRKKTRKKGAEFL